MEICIALRAHVAQEGLYFYFSVDRVVQMVAKWQCINLCAVFFWTTVFLWCNYHEDVYNSYI